jgi:pleiotropic regulator 1
MDTASSRASAARGKGGVAASETAPLARAGAADGTSTALTLTGSAASVRDVVAAFAARSAPAGLDTDDDATRAQYAKVEELTARAQERSRAMIARRAPPPVPVPEWHQPWKLMRVISGHIGWVRSVAVDPGNEWFVTGGADRLIKIWDLASGTLKLTLTGHINAVRALAVSSRHPYMFSGSEDKQVFCWDLEYNKVIRKYTGHLSGVYSLALHPTLDVVFTGGRDSVCRVWDMRTKAQVHVLSGHDNSVTSILANSTDPQVITGSQDSTIRTWDLVAGKVRTVLTHHKKGVRALVSHPKEWAFVSGAGENLKKWALPDATFVKNYSGHDAIINALALNADGVLVSGGDNGSLSFWDYATGYRFQTALSRPQPGSLDSEAGIYAATFDQTGL